MPFLSFSSNIHPKKFVRQNSYLKFSPINFIHYSCQNPSLINKVSTPCPIGSVRDERSSHLFRFLNRREKLQSDFRHLFLQDMVLRNKCIDTVFFSLAKPLRPVFTNLVDHTINFLLSIFYWILVKIVIAKISPFLLRISKNRVVVLSTILWPDKFWSCVSADWFTLASFSSRVV